MIDEAGDRRQAGPVLQRDEPAGNCDHGDGPGESSAAERARRHGQAAARRRCRSLAGAPLHAPVLIGSRDSEVSTQCPGETGQSLKVSQIAADPPVQRPTSKRRKAPACTARALKKLSGWRSPSTAPLSAASETSSGNTQAQRLIPQPGLVLDRPSPISPNPGPLRRGRIKRSSERSTDDRSDAWSLPAIFGRASTVRAHGRGHRETSRRPAAAPRPAADSSARRRSSAPRSCRRRPFRAAHSRA